MELQQGEDGSDKQNFWVDFFFRVLLALSCIAGMSPAGAARLSARGPWLGLAGLSAIAGSVQGGEQWGLYGPTAPVPWAVCLSCSHQSRLLQFQILPPQLINVPGADISVTIVFCN